MSKAKSNKKLQQKIQKLEKASEQIVGGRGYIQESQKLRNFEKNLKEELTKKNEVTASSVFLNRMHHKFS